MSHNPYCIRSEGDWICVPQCTHDREEARADELGSLRRLVRALEDQQALYKREHDRAWERLASACRQRDEAVRRLAERDTKIAALESALRRASAVIVPLVLANMDK